MAATETKLEYPTGADLFQPHRDIENLARSATVIVPVANRAEADAIASSFNPSPSKPLYVDRADTGALERNSGNGWVRYGRASSFHARSLTATKSLPNATYDWLGAMDPISATGTASSPPPEFSYETGDATTYGQGLQANVSGLFRLAAQVTFAANATGNRYLRAVVNGATIKRAFAPATSGATTLVELAVTARLEPGDRLGVQAYQNSGGSLNLVTDGNHPTQIAMEYLG